MIMDCVIDTCSDHLCFSADVGNEDPGRVVALASGHCAVEPKVVGCDGRTIKDTHAEAMARRALIK